MGIMESEKRGKIRPLSSFAWLYGALHIGKAKMLSTGSAIKKNGLFCLNVKKGKDFIHQGG